MRVLAGTIVDWATIGKVVLASLAAGVGASVCFAFAILGATRFADMRRGDRPIEAGFYAVLAFAGLTATVGAIVVGIVVMTKK